MPITFIGSAAHSGNPTTSFTVTIPTVAVDDLLVLLTVNGGATAVPTITDNDTGGNTWTRKSSTTVKGQIYYKRATSATSAKTISGSGFTNSCTALLFVLRGAISSGDPFEQFTTEENIAGNETHAGFTTTTDGCYVGLAVANGASNGDSAAPSTFATATSPGALDNLTTAVSTGGVDCGGSMAGKVQTTAGATGNFTWAQADLATTSYAFAIKQQTLDGTGNGGTVTVTASTVNGAATGGGSASGVTVSPTISVLAGEASGSTAPGIFDPGIFDSGIFDTPAIDANASGATVSIQVSAIGGNATGGASTGAGSLVISPAITNGTSTGGASALGQAVLVTPSVVSGAATGGASAGGTTIAPTLSVVAGTASGSASTGGAAAVVTTSIIAGSASTSSNGDASGETVTVNATIVDGAASGSSSANGATVGVTSSVVNGTATGSASANGATVQSTFSLSNGAATGGASAGSATLAISVSVIGGSASGEGAATAGGDTVVALVSIIEGVGVAANDNNGLHMPLLRRRRR